MGQRGSRPSRVRLSAPKRHLQPNNDKEMDDYNRLGERIRGLPHSVHETWHRMWGTAVSADPARPHLLAELVDRVTNPIEGTFEVWALLARNAGIHALARLGGGSRWQIGEALVRGDDMRPMLSELGAQLTDDQVVWMQRAAESARQFVAAVLSEPNGQEHTRAAAAAAAAAAEDDDEPQRRVRARVQQSPRGHQPGEVVGAAAEQCGRLEELVELVDLRAAHVTRCVRAGRPTIAPSGRPDLLEAALARHPVCFELVAAILESRARSVQESSDPRTQLETAYAIDKSAIEAARRAADSGRHDILRALLEAGAVFMNSGLVVDIDTPGSNGRRYIDLRAYIDAARRRTRLLPWHSSGMAGAAPLARRTADDLVDAFASGERALAAGIYEGVPAPHGVLMQGDRRIELVRLGEWDLSFPTNRPAEISGPADANATRLVELARRIASRSQAQAYDIHAVGLRWPPTLQESAISRELGAAEQVASAARGVVGPHVATGTYLKTKWPSGAEIELWVVCLGERHQPLPDMPEYTSVRGIMQAAARRARRRGVCADLFLEASWRRSVYRDDAWVRRDRSRPCQVTTLNPHGPRYGILGIAWSMAGAVAPPHAVVAPQHRPLNPLGSTGVRVHWFDSRAELDAGGIVHAMYYKTPLTVIRPALARIWTLSILGYDASRRRVDPSRPLSDGLLKELQRTIGPIKATEWVARHTAGLERMARRASRIPPEDLEWLVNHLVETMLTLRVEAYGGVRMAIIYACVADFYLLLRMLVPYPTGPACDAGPARHCLVYAGALHTEHVTECLESMGRQPGAILETWSVESPEGVDDHLEVPIDRILEGMGLSDDVEQ